jgi:hypothetical protein
MLAYSLKSEQRLNSVVISNRNKRRVFILLIQSFRIIVSVYPYPKIRITVKD